MANPKIIIPLPSYGFDPSEVAIAWKLFSEQGYELTFVTPNGKQASADQLMLTGKKLGIWKPLLQARNDACFAYDEMLQAKSFNQPLSYEVVEERDYSAIYLPGGHDKAVQEYLESKVLQKLVADFFIADKPVAAICHGVVLVARSINPKTAKSVIHEYKTTSLLKSQELLAFNLTRLWLKDYYLTYPDLTVEEEVRSVLAEDNNFLQGPTPLLKDDLNHLDRGFVVKDKNYISARWPGDIYNLSMGFIKMINHHHEK